MSKMPRSTLPPAVTHIPKLRRISNMGDHRKPFKGHSRKNAVTLPSVWRK